MWLGLDAVNFYDSHVMSVDGEIKCRNASCVYHSESVSLVRLNIDHGQSNVILRARQRRLASTAVY